MRGKAGEFIKKQVGGSKLTSGVEEAAPTLGGIGLVESVARRESAPEDGRTRLTPEQSGRRLLAVILLNSSVLRV